MTGRFQQNDDEWWRRPFKDNSTCSKQYLLFWVHCGHNMFTNLTFSLTVLPQNCCIINCICNCYFVVHLRSIWLPPSWMRMHSEGWNYFAYDVMLETWHHEINVWVPVLLGIIYKPYFNATSWGFTQTFYFLARTLHRVIVPCSLL